MTLREELQHELNAALVDMAKAKARADEIQAEIDSLKAGDGLPAGYIWADSETYPVRAVEASGAWIGIAKSARGPLYLYSDMSALPLDLVRAVVDRYDAQVPCSSAS